jgi:hypothetical protein
VDENGRLGIVAVGHWLMIAACVGGCALRYNYPPRPRGQSRVLSRATGSISCRLKAGLRKRWASFLGLWTPQSTSKEMR